MRHIFRRKQSSKCLVELVLSSAAWKYKFNVFAFNAETIINCPFNGNLCGGKLLTTSRALIATWTFPLEGTLCCIIFNTRRRSQCFFTFRNIVKTDYIICLSLRLRFTVSSKVRHACRSRRLRAEKVLMFQSWWVKKTSSGNVEIMKLKRAADKAHLSRCLLNEVWRKWCFQSQKRLWTNENIRFR